MYFDSIILASLITILATTLVVVVSVYYGYKHILKDIKDHPDETK